MQIRFRLITWDAGPAYIAHDTFPVFPLRCLLDTFCSEIDQGREFLGATFIFEVWEKKDKGRRTLTKPVGTILQNLSLESRVQTSNAHREYHLLDVQCMLFPTEKAIVGCQRCPIGTLQTGMSTQRENY